MLVRKLIHGTLSPILIAFAIAGAALAARGCTNEYQIEADLSDLKVPQPSLSVSAPVTYNECPPIPACICNCGSGGTITDAPEEAQDQ